MQDLVEFFTLKSLLREAAIMSSVCTLLYRNSIRQPPIASPRLPADAQMISLSFPVRILKTIL